MILNAFRSNLGKLLVNLGWWALFSLCALYAVFALYMAGFEILSQLAIVEDAPHRATPLVFIVHALSGGVALIGSALQLTQWIQTRHRKVHRVIGRVYVVAVWLSSVAALWAATSFDVSKATKIVFGVLAALWFVTTTIGFLRARQHQFTEHREWMIRSFSLSFFFITFSLWVPVLESTNLPEAVAYPLAVFLSWSLNLLASEIWIRHTRYRSLRLASHSSIIPPRADLKNPSGVRRVLTHDG